ncbi:MAG TPA: glycosyltransferase [Anaerolineales bacterium]|nr:glycosyltransferase [Anaerolineales bacterium]
MGLALGMWAGTTNDFRVKTLGLRPLSAFADPTRLPDGSPMTVLYPYSSHLVPVPDDFPANVHVTGYWFLDAEPGWQPSEALQRFLESGPPPVYIGFGSMGGMRPKQRTQAVLEALAATGQRGLLASGWGGLGAADLPENVHMLSAAPHDWLFPRMNAIVHHGGAGTTAAALRAGRPSVICPFLGDQPFWGWAVAQAGAGPEPIPQHRLTAKRLADALAIAVNDQDLRHRAERLGAQIRAEDGIANAIALLTATAST